MDELCRRVLAAADGSGRPFELVLVNDCSTDATWAPDAGGRARGSPGRGDRSVAKPRSPARPLRRADLLPGTGPDSRCRSPGSPGAASPDDGADGRGRRRRVRPAAEPSGETFFKLATAHLFYRLIERCTDRPDSPETGDFRLMSRRALEVLLAMPERHRFIRGMVSWIGFRQILFFTTARPALPARPSTRCSRWCASPSTR